jgi:hypothetical protein
MDTGSSGCHAWVRSVSSFLGSSRRRPSSVTEQDAPCPLSIGMISLYVSLISGDNCILAVLNLNFAEFFMWNFMLSGYFSQKGST